MEKETVILDPGVIRIELAFSERPMELAFPVTMKVPFESFMKSVPTAARVDRFSGDDK